MTGSYTQKLLRATLILPQGHFQAFTQVAPFAFVQDNTLTLVGYRMSATIQTQAKYPATLDLMIYGMDEADMNAVTILWSASGVALTAQNAKALIQLEASADGKAWTQVFEGQFSQAAPDYTGIPYAGLRLQAWEGNGFQMAIAPPTSYSGATSIASIAEYLAGKMGFAFENNGVTGNLSRPYYPGTYMDQFRQLADHANFDFYFDGNATLAICPANQPRKGKPVPVFSPTSGLIGFPSVQQYGIGCQVLWTPALTIGGTIQVADSIVPGANGTWSVYSATHQLDCLMPSGQWFSSLDCSRPPS